MADIEIDPSQVHSIEVDPSDVKPQGSAISRFGKGLYDTTVGPVVQAVSHPIDTAVGFGKQIVGVDQLHEIADHVKAGNYGKATEAALAYQRGDRFMNSFADPIIEDVKSGDLAGAAGRTVGLLAPLGVKPALSAVSKIPGLDTAANAAANTLREGAVKQYGKVLNATKIGNKIRSAEVAPELVKRGITAFSMKSLKGQAAAHLESAGQAIGDAYEGLPQDASVPVGPIIDRMKSQAASQFMIDAPEGPMPAPREVGTGLVDSHGSELTRMVQDSPKAAGKIPMSPLAENGMNHVKGLGEVISDVAERDPQTGEMGIPVDTARRLRQYYDQIAKDAGRYDGKALADQTAGAAHGMAADAIRSELASQFPDIAKLNKEYSFWKDVDRVVGDTMLRREGQAKPLGSKLAKGAGQIMGGAHGGLPGAALGGAAMEQLTNLTSSPAWNTVSAVLKNGLADAIAYGNPSKANFFLKRIGSAVGAINGTRQPSTVLQFPKAADNDSQSPQVARLQP
jgi:hypothetical protein